MRAKSCDYQQDDVRGSDEQRDAQDPRGPLRSAMGVHVHVFSLNQLSAVSYQPFSSAVVGLTAGICVEVFLTAES
jgi:hypothetical protein